MKIRLTSPFTLAAGLAVAAVLAWAVSKAVAEPPEEILHRILERSQLNLPIARPYQIERHARTSFIRGGTQDNFKIRLRKGEAGVILDHPDIARVMRFFRRTEFYRYPRIAWWNTTSLVHYAGSIHDLASQTSVRIYLAWEGEDEWLFVESFTP